MSPMKRLLNHHPVSRSKNFIESHDWDMFAPTGNSFPMMRASLLSPPSIYKYGVLEFLVIQ